MKKIIIGTFVSILALTSPSISYADSQPGDMIITLGENLTEQQKSQLLQEMKSTQDAVIVKVSNAEEHTYLGNYIPKPQIGTKALSSSSITIGEKDSGLVVNTNNINWVTNEMYVNALITAGVKDAKIYVTAPFPVSGTAGLTGLIKAYEVSTGEVIPEEQKQIANEEMVETAKLGESIGDENASSLTARIKEKIAANKPENEEEMKNLILQAAQDTGVSLTDAQLDGLIDLFTRMQDLNIDWNQVGDQLAVAKEKFDNFVESQEAQNIIEKAKDFFGAIFEAVKSWFN